MRISVGVDDTDSPRGGCTTYLSATLIPKLESLGAAFTDYPLLVRLNPNSPWKTRGNGAVCLRLEAPREKAREILRTVIGEVERQADFECENTNPGVVLHYGEVPPRLEGFYEEALHKILDIEDAEKLIAEVEAESVGFKNRRGLVGALAAVGATLTGDHTYELLTYRTLENRGSIRRIDENSVRVMDAELHDSTFNSVDPETGQILIAPRGPDPVLYGVRGESPEAVYAAMQMVKPLEPVERWVIFRSNQGTGVHLQWRERIEDLKPRHQAVIQGSVVNPPRASVGGHVFFRLRDSTGEVDGAAYEPSKEFRRTVERLAESDVVELGGGVRESEAGLTLNVEYLKPLSLERVVKKINPKCPSCGGGTESMGRGQGYRCRRCGEKMRERSKQEREVPRGLIEGWLYLPPPRAERHLTRPPARLNRRNPYSPTPLHLPWRG